MSRSAILLPFSPQTFFGLEKDIYFSYILIQFFRLSFLSNINFTFSEHTNLTDKQQTKGFRCNRSCSGVCMILGVCESACACVCVRVCVCVCARTHDLSTCVLLPPPRPTRGERVFLVFYRLFLLTSSHSILFFNRLIEHNTTLEPRSDLNFNNTRQKDRLH